MTDVHTPEQRSYNMSRIKGKDTNPEVIVRRQLHAMGFRFRLHDTNLPGKPDIVMKKHRTAVFVHGCFWHRHKGCKFSYVPKSRVNFWQKKFEANVRRDRQVTEQLAAAGWLQFIVWECQTKDKDRLVAVIKEFFDDESESACGK